MTADKAKILAAYYAAKAKEWLALLIPKIKEAVKEEPQDKNIN
jgi:hypothetical protein